MSMNARKLHEYLRQVLGALCLLMCWAVAQAQDDPPGRVGRIAEVQGEVWLFDVEQNEWVSAQRNRPWTQGDRVATGVAGRAELSVGSTSLMLGSDAELDVLRLDDDGIQLHLLRGSLAVRLRSREVAGELQVVTDEGQFLFQRGGLYRVNRHGAVSDASVWRGDMSFQTQDFLLPLQAGQAAEFWQDGPQRTTRSRWLTPLNDDFALAVAQQEQAEQRGAATRYVSPEMTGAEELDRHGSWQEHVDYGPVWIPAAVPLGWAPYRFGQWAWIRPWGWTWVDNTAWGFAPFHYGRWVWWDGRWGWAPGPRAIRPVYAPALVGWVGAGHAQFSVNVGGRAVPAVGWVPLAPREVYHPGYRSSAGYFERINAGRAQSAGALPTYRNRAVPGAVTVLPAQSLVSRQPVAAAALQGDTTRLPVEHFHPYAPARPAVPTREQLAPRPASAVVTVPRVTSPVPAGADGATPPPRDAATRPSGQSGGAAALGPPAPVAPAVLPNAAQGAQGPQGPRWPMASPAVQAVQPVPSMPVQPSSPNATQGVPNRAAMPTAPNQSPRNDPRTNPPAHATAALSPAGAVQNMPPTAPPRAANRPAPSGAPAAVAAGPGVPVPGSKPAATPAALATPPARPAAPPPVAHGDNARVAPPARNENVDGKPAGQDSGADKATAPTMRTPQSRFKVREP